MSMTRMAIASIRIKLDGNTVYHGRVSDNFFNGLVRVGGFSVCAYFIGMVLVYMINERLFKGSFLRQLY
jgi:hypothetical protein